MTPAAKGPAGLGHRPEQDLDAGTVAADGGAVHQLLKIDLLRHLASRLSEPDAQLSPALDDVIRRENIVMAPELDKGRRAGDARLRLTGGFRIQPQR